VCARGCAFINRVEFVLACVSVIDAREMLGMTSPDFDRRPECKLPRYNSTGSLQSTEEGPSMMAGLSDGAALARPALTGAASAATVLWPVPLQALQSLRPRTDSSNTDSMAPTLAGTDTGAGSDSDGGLPASSTVPSSMSNHPRSMLSPAMLGSSIPGSAASGTRYEEDSPHMDIDSVAMETASMTLSAATSHAADDADGTTSSHFDHSSHARLG